MANLDQRFIQNLNMTGYGIYFDRGQQQAGQSVYFNGWQFKNLGSINFRADNRYLDIKTNTGGEMQAFLVMGYLYNSGNIFSFHGSYSYIGNSILNQFTQNLGSSHIMRSYRTTGGSQWLCLKMDRFSSGYSEGWLSIYYHTHGTGQNTTEITAYAQNNSTGDFYTS